MNYLIEILIIIIVIAIWQGIMFLLRRNYNIGVRDGGIKVITQIFNEIKQKGKIDITLNNQKILVGELKKR